IAKIRWGMARINTIKARDSQCTVVFGLDGRAAQRETGTESTTANAVAKKTMARVSTIIAVSSPIGGKSNGNMRETKVTALSADCNNVGMLMPMELTDQAPAAANPIRTISADIWII